MSKQEESSSACDLIRRPNKKLNIVEKSAQCRGKTVMDAI